MANDRHILLWDDLSAKGRMYLVLALCCLMLLVSTVAALLVVGKPEADGDGAGDAQQMVAENNYNMHENTIDQGLYGDTILPGTDDAGEEYVAQTLFLGDSNTARMYRLFNYCSYDNAIGSVGMSARSLANYACVGFAGYSNYQTMPEAVALLQPQRVVITFGTNDLNPNTATETFIANYETGILAVQNAYPSVDIIVNSIPPLGHERSSQYLTQKQVDEWNLAIVEMCQKNGWKFLNSAEALKDSGTGFAKSGYVENSDGIHLTSAGLDAFFAYFRTHSYITKDDRPTVQNVPKHNDDRDVTQVQVALASPTPEEDLEPSPSPSEEPTAPPSAEPSAKPTEPPAPTPTPTPPPTPTPTPPPTAAPTPTPTEPPAESTDPPATEAPEPTSGETLGNEGTESPAPDT